MCLCVCVECVRARVLSVVDFPNGNSSFRNEKENQVCGEIFIADVSRTEFSSSVVKKNYTNHNQTRARYNERRNRS